MDRKQVRAFEGFVTESGDALLRMTMLLTADPDAMTCTHHRTSRPASSAASAAGGCGTAR